MLIMTATITQEAKSRAFREIKRQHEEAGRSLLAIAEELGINSSLVWRAYNAGYVAPSVVTAMQDSQWIEPEVRYRVALEFPDKQQQRDFINLVGRLGEDRREQSLVLLNMLREKDEVEL